MKYIIFLTVFVLFFGINFPEVLANQQEEEINVDLLLKNIPESPFEEKIPVIVEAPKPVLVPQAVAQPTPARVTEQPLKPVPVVVEKVAEVVPPKKPNFIVEGVIWSDTIHEAVINGQLVTVGDRVADALVIDINREGVIVDVKGTKFTMPVQ